MNDDTIPILCDNQVFLWRGIAFKSVRSAVEKLEGGASVISEIS